MESTSSTIAASAAESDTGSLDSAAVATWCADAATGSLDEFALDRWADDGGLMPESVGPHLRKGDEHQHV
jgi:hypothetical protein